MASDNASSKKRPRVIDLEDDVQETDVLPKRPLTPNDEEEMLGEAHVPVTQQSSGSLVQLGPVFDEIFRHLPTTEFRKTFSRLFLTMSKAVMWHLGQMRTYVIMQHNRQCDAKCACNLIPSIMTTPAGRRRTVRVKELQILFHANNKLHTKDAILKQPTGLVELKMSLNRALTEHGDRRVGLSQVAIAAIPSAPTLTSLTIGVGRNSGDLPLNFDKFVSLKSLTVNVINREQAKDIFLGVRWPPNLTHLDAPDLPFLDCAMVAPEMLTSLTCAVFGGAPGWEAKFPSLRSLTLTSIDWYKYPHHIHGLPPHVEVLSIPFPVGGDSQMWCLDNVTNLIPRSVTRIQQCSTGDPGWCDLSDVKTALNVPGLQMFRRAKFRVSGDPIAAFGVLAFTSIRVLSVVDAYIIDGAFSTGLRQLQHLESLIIYKCAMAGYRRPVQANHGITTLPCTPTIKRIRIVHDASCLPDSRQQGMFHPQDMFRLMPLYQPVTLVLPNDPADVASLEMIGVYGPAAIMIMGYDESMGRSLNGEVVYESQTNYLPIDLQLTVLNTAHMQTYKYAKLPTTHASVTRARYAFAFSISPGSLADQSARVSIRSVPLASLQDDYSARSMYKQ